MTLTGWVLMLTSTLFVVGLWLFCVVRILRAEAGRQRGATDGDCAHICRGDSVNLDPHG